MSNREKVMTGLLVVALVGCAYRAVKTIKIIREREALEVAEQN